MSRIIQVLLCYAVQDIFEYYSSTRAKIFSNITHQPRFVLFFQSMPSKNFWHKRAVCAQALLSTSFDREKKREALVSPSSNYLLPRVYQTAIKVQSLSFIKVIINFIKRASA